MKEIGAIPIFYSIQKKEKLMQYRKLGKTEIQASVLAFGSWAAGGWMWGGTDEKDAIAAIRTALEHGVNFIDTTPIYGFGRSEEIVGKAIRSVPRDQVILATKCGLVWEKADWPTGKGTFHFYSTDLGYGTGAPSDWRVYRYLRPESIRAEVEASLRRLQTDYLDLLQTHWQDATSRISETMGTLLDLKAEGKIRMIGASNVQCAELEEYFALGDVDVIQERFSLLDRKIETNGLLEYARSHEMSLLPYSPLCRGLLTGRMGPDRKFNPGDRRNYEERFSPGNRTKVNQMLAALEPLAASRGLTIAQLLLAWTFSRYEKTHVLSGARSPEQVLENVKAGDVVLSQEEMAVIESTYQQFEL